MMTTNETFVEYIANNYDKLRYQIAGMIHWNYEDAEDILGDIALDSAKLDAGWDGICNKTTLIITAAKNRYKNNLRTRQRELARYEKAAISEEYIPESAVEIASRFLTEEELSVLNLFILDGYKTSDVVNILCNKGVTYYRAWKIITSIREKIQEALYE